MNKDESNNIVPALNSINKTIHCDNTGVFIHVRAEHVNLKKYLFMFYSGDLGEDSCN